MTFEKAIEAMRQGKKVYRKAWRDTEIYLSSTTLFTMTCDDAFADDWEIYEELKLETAEERAARILSLLRIRLVNEKVDKYCLDAIDFAVKTLKVQNRPKPEKESKCGFNCKIQPAKFFPDDIPTLAFDMFTAGLKFGLEIAKDLQKEKSENE